MSGKILIIVPPVRLSSPPTRFPLGLAYLAASLEQNGFKVNVLDLNILRLPPPAEEELVQRSLEGVNLVATGGMITMLNAISRIASYVDKYQPGLPVIVGGPISACLQEQILRNTKIKILVTGEGEITGPQLASALIHKTNKLKNIPGLAYLEDNELIATEPSQRIDDLDSLAMPAYHLFPFSTYLQNRKARITDLIGSRGCPFKCTFCFRNFGNKVVFRSVDSIIKEIRFLKKFYNIQHVHLEDELFVQRKDFIYDFCHRIQEINGLTWSACARVNTISLDIIRKMKDAGCKGLMIGIESFSNAILTKMNKGVSVEQVDQACAVMNEVGVEIWPGLIIGMPGETKETIRMTVEGCLRHNIKINESTYAFATPYPGTKLYSFAIQKGLITDEWDYIQKLNFSGDTNSMIINLTDLTDVDLVEARRQAIEEVDAHLRRRSKMNTRKGSNNSRLIRSIVSRLKKHTISNGASNRKTVRLAKNNPFACVRKDHFSRSLSSKKSKLLFKKSIRMIEVEVFSYCNRSCWFCPNSHIDRKSENKYMDEKIYLKILKNLGDIGYSGIISYSRYNEPLADKMIFVRLRQAKDAVPKALLHFNTNGDYFSRDILQKLYLNGLRSLNIQVYLPNKVEYSDVLAVDYLMQRIEKYGLPYEFVRSSPLDWLEYRLFFDDMNIRIYARNFGRNGTDRGAAIQELSREKPRTSPCLIPFTDIYVDYNGKLVPCCNIRSDLLEHSDFILGDLRGDNQDIFSIFQSDAAIDFRKKMFRFQPKEFPCIGCSFAQIEPTHANMSRADLILRRWSNRQ
jgi:radical SAM superfamily enzyme YgiQ (UPF0313 family)